MGIPYLKYIGMADQLQDLLFLATLEQLARPFYWDRIMKIDFSRTAEDQAILNVVEAEGACDAKDAVTLLNRRRRTGLRKAA